MDGGVAATVPRRHVPGIGPSPCRIALFGEAPGETENAVGEPFVGQAGKELNRYLRAAGLFRSDCYISNVVKFWPPVLPNGKQLPPSKDDIRRDEAELMMELDIVQPEIIVAIGAHSARYFLGDRFKSLWREHGIPRIAGMPILERDVIVLPCVHPAAGLHNQVQEEQERIQWDFEQLGLLLRGQIAAIPDEERDLYPDAKYERLYDTENGADILANIIAGRTYIYLDTEGPYYDPECATVSVVPGEGWFIPHTEHETLAVLEHHINASGGICTVGCHYLAHDIPVLAAMDIRVDRRPALNSDGSPALRCTMLEAHLLGGMEPKGLKPEMWRLAGMDGEGFEDVVGETEQKNARDYLTRIYDDFRCMKCGGNGKLEEKWRSVDPNCEQCWGSGRVVGAKKGSTKYCPCAKLTDRCPDCIDGLYIARPERELIVDKGEFRWKQSQSLAKWVKKRIAGKEEESEPDAEAAEELLAEEESDDKAPVHQFFKLRHDWDGLERRSDKIQVEQMLGKMRRTRLADMDDQHRVTRYACRDSDAGLRISPVLEKRLGDLGLLEARRIDARMIPMLSRMEQIGVRIDRPHFEQFSIDLGRQMQEDQEKLNDLVGERNPNSRRLADVLFRQLHLPSIKLTKGGQEALDDEVLETLKLQLRHRSGPDADTGIAVIDCIQGYRERQKLKGTYVDVYLEQADRDDCVHTTIKYTRSMTRLSSEDPNLQNLGNPDNHPAGDDPIANTSLRLRNGIIAPDGYELIEADYSSIELVVGAHLTQDRNLLRIFREGLDPHRYVGSQLTGIPMNEVPKRVRTQSKKLNFSAYYDTSAPTLQKQFALMSPPIEMTVEECEKLIGWYFSDFAPDVLKWKDQTRRQARIDGYVKTMFGRLRWMPGLRSDIKRVKSAAERECTNAPIQGTARDILAVAMGDIWEYVLPQFWAEGVDLQCLMTVHDSLLFKVPKEHAGTAAVMIGATMADAVKLSVPVKVGVKSGFRWGSL